MRLHDCLKHQSLSNWDLPLAHFKMDFTGAKISSRNASTIYLVPLY